MKKFTVADFGLKTDGLPQDQATFMNNIANMMCNVINKAMEGVISPDDMESRLKSLNEKFNGYDDEKFKQLLPRITRNSLKRLKVLVRLSRS